MASASAQRRRRLTERLLAFSRRQSLDAKPLDVNDLVASLLDLLRRTVGERITIEVALDADSLLIADGNQLESAILNLSINARDAMPEGGQLRIETSVVDERQVVGLGRTTAAPSYASPSPTREWACRAKCSTRCSSRSSPPSPSARAPGWACRWSTASLSRAAAR
ncbi:hypothetical protein ACRAWD_30420 [Caulobacter segnis]